MTSSEQVLDLTPYGESTVTRVELDFGIVGVHPVGTTEEEATQIEAGAFASAFSGQYDSEKVRAEIVRLNGPAGGTAVVAFIGPFDRVAGLAASFYAQAYLNVEDSAFTRLGQAPIDHMKDQGLPS